MTKGEQMLIDLGYEMKCISDFEILFESYATEIVFDTQYKTVESAYVRNEESQCLNAKEVQAIYQIMIDYGWIESGVEE